MAQRLNHEELVRRGLELHDARRYSTALSYFDHALRLSPSCPVALYNRANTLHMLGRDSDAEPILRNLVVQSVEELRAACPVVRPRSLRLDAFYLLFLVMVYGQGFSEEAFEFASQHLEQRQRGVQSIWSVREVRAELAAFREEWTTDSTNQSRYRTQVSLVDNRN